MDFKNNGAIIVNHFLLGRSVRTVNQKLIHSRKDLTSSTCRTKIKLPLSLYGMSNQVNKKNRSKNGSYITGHLSYCTR